MGACIVSLIIYDKNPCKKLSNNSQNFDSSYTENKINETSPCLDSGKSRTKK